MIKNEPKSISEDEFTKNIQKNKFIKDMESCRTIFINAMERESRIFAEIEDAFPELDLSNCVTFAENANNIQDAISCYLQYGEYSPKKIWGDLVLAKKTIDTLPTEEAKKCFGKK